MVSQPVLIRNRRLLHSTLAGVTCHPTTRRVSAALRPLPVNRQQPSSRAAVEPLTGRAWQRELSSGS